MSTERWVEDEILIDTSRGTVTVLGYQIAGDECPLAVTPNQDGLDYVITHVHSGRRLWPNHWPLRRAQRICAELIALGGWSRDYDAILFDADLRRKAEEVVRRAGL